MKLRGRYGISAEVIETPEPDTWLITFTEPDHVRMGVGEGRLVTFVDPPGGPFIQPGDDLGFGVIDWIEFTKDYRTLIHTKP